MRHLSGSAPELCAHAGAAKNERDCGVVEKPIATIGSLMAASLWAMGRFFDLGSKVERGGNSKPDAAVAA
jgi:hypothetical protein